MEVLIFDLRVEEFIKGLVPAARLKAERGIELLEEFGNRIASPHSKMLCPGIFELRMPGTPAVRLLYTFFQDKAYVLHGFIKKTAKTPKRELDVAVRALKQLRQR